MLLSQCQWVTETGDPLLTGVGFKRVPYTPKTSDAFGLPTLPSDSPRTPENSPGLLDSLRRFDTDARVGSVWVGEGFWAKNRHSRERGGCLTETLR